MRTASMIQGLNIIKLHHGWWLSDVGYGVPAEGVDGGHP